ncbi:hypothetical protein K2O51_31875 (plasmid) [Cupriavidus pinatubonensis]|uniref:hypothetical protein n=1 Tax=Cupriavidus pinatubonensis TaxID=248026 RepID=UPI001C72FAA4|nr:hypothetical protein [Cupriavidus pinatubonensis]QYY33626.1 hypothetical protein K2O51_31875 [Cupriavidus pinatubonensis]
MYKHHPTDSETLIWELEVFGRFDNDFIVEALRAHVRSSEFAPRPNSIWRAAGSADSVSPRLALEQIVHAVKRDGPYRSPVLDNPQVAMTIAHLGGWSTVCKEIPDPTNGFDYERYAKRFEAAYEAARADINVRKLTPPPVLGLTDAVKARPVPSGLVALAGAQ